MSRPPVRRTRQREAIEDAFRAAGRPLSPEGCRERASATVPGLGIATVYRNIGRLVEEGWLRVVALPGSPDRYEVAGKHHHHHFHCRACDGVFEVEACPGGFTGMAPGGFQVDHHEVMLYGLCGGCA